MNNRAFLQSSTHLPQEPKETTERFFLSKQESERNNRAVLGVFLCFRSKKNNRAFLGVLREANTRAVLGVLREARRTPERQRTPPLAASQKPDGVFQNKKPGFVSKEEARFVSRRPALPLKKTRRRTRKKTRDHVVSC